MGLLGKTLNDRSTQQKKPEKSELNIRMVNQEEMDTQNKINKKKFGFLKSVMEQEKILTKVNRQKLLEIWIEMMKEVKANNLLEEITLHNQVFER
jgi:hypothetical protein